MKLTQLNQDIKLNPAILWLIFSLSSFPVYAADVSVQEAKELAALNLTTKAIATCNPTLGTYTAQTCCANENVKVNFYKTLSSQQQFLELNEKDPTNKDAINTLVEDFGSAALNIDDLAKDSISSKMTIPSNCDQTRLTNAEVKFKATYTELIKQNPSFLDAKNSQAVCEKLVGLYLSGKSSFLAAAEADASLCDPVSALKTTPSALPSSDTSAKTQELSKEKTSSGSGSKAQ